MTLFCSSVCPLSNPQKVATLTSNSDQACLAIKEASLSGKSKSLSSSIRDSEGTRLAPEVEGSSLQLALEAELEPEATPELELEPVARHVTRQIHWPSWRGHKCASVRCGLTIGHGMPAIGCNAAPCGAPHVHTLSNQCGALRRRDYIIHGQGLTMA